jgi:hypothetical protein
MEETEADAPNGESSEVATSDGSLPQPPGSECNNTYDGAGDIHGSNSLYKKPEESVKDGDVFSFKDHNGDKSGSMNGHCTRLLRNRDIKQEQKDEFEQASSSGKLPLLYVI